MSHTHRYHNMGKGGSAVLSLFLCISTHIVCAEKVEEDKAMVKDHRMAMEVNSEADETILGLDAHNRNEASSDDVAHEFQEDLTANKFCCKRCEHCLIAAYTPNQMDDTMCIACACLPGVDPPSTRP